MIPKTNSDDTRFADLHDGLGKLQEEFDRATAKPIETRQADKRSYVVFKLGRELFAWPVANLTQIVVNRRIVTLPGRQKSFYGVMNYKNKTLSVTNLHHLLNLGSMKTDQITTLLISKGLMVDTAFAVNRLVTIVSVAVNAIAPKPISMTDAASMIAGEFFHREQMVTVLNPDAFSG